MMNPYIKRKIMRRLGASSREIEDYIAVEKKLSISLNGKHIINLLCTPIMIEELINGFFLTEGILTDRILPEDMKIDCGEEISVDINAENSDISELTASRCLGGITFNKKRTFEKINDRFTIPAEAIQSLFEEFHQKSQLFRLTGCFHSAALSDGEKIIAFAEDVGRHNAVDKMIGAAILKDILFKETLLLVSCRLSSEIVSKCSRCKVPILASRAAPTDLAIEIAEKSGITLMGFVRGDRLNIYTHEQRILQ
ncbi:MAG: formate dehydrogenase accessory sulfurtransferase FdhD [Nitrospirae bacterium]|nr:formate dehydrogenase accessory sulfurtransferase FdhD [Nitrospirota bacterium]